MVPEVARLEGPVRSYAWGSHRLLAELEGRPAPTPGPEAERWFGAHPRAPSQLVVGPGRRRPLDAVIADDPALVLGAAVLDRFGPRLPFLTKLLAAGAPLSLQAHPDAARAAAGYAAEQAAGVPHDAAHRRFSDPWAKPELIRAVTPFTALAGLRSWERTAELLALLDAPGLSAVLAPPDGDDHLGTRTVLSRVLTLPRPRAAALVAELATAAARARGGAQPAAWRPELDQLADLAARFPADPGVLVAVLLELVRLAPGEALFLPPGTLHAYLAGAGVEVMGASDNVVRGGLTSKPVDVAGLLEVAAPVGGGALRVGVAPGVVHEQRRPTPTPEVRCSELELPAGAATTLDPRGPEVLLCLAGTVRITAAAAEVTLPPGTAAFVSAAAREVRVAAPGSLDGAPASVVRTTVGDPG